MKIQTPRKNALLAFGALALLSASFAAAPVRAQDAPGDNGRPISLNLQNVPIQTALRTLFSSAGIRNYSIDPGVQGYANINVSDVPFSTALSSLLGAASPPLDSSVVNGVYTVKVKAASAPPAVTVANNADGTSGATSTTDQPKRFYVIPINSYDAYYIATLIGQTGVVEVVPNYPAGGGGGQGGVGQGGGQGGFGQSGRGGFGGANVTTVGGGGFGGGSSFGGSGFGGGSSFGGGGFGGGFGR